jgi:DNA-binding transcriptional MerR regulator
MALKKLKPQPVAKSTRKTGEVVIPDKLYFRIGEVAELCGVPTYVLRFWETEFPHLRPGKSGTGQRTYRRRDVEAILYVRSLLYDRGFTIAGARQFMRSEARATRGQNVLPFAEPAPERETLRKVKVELLDILGLLSARR